MKKGLKIIGAILLLLFLGLLIVPYIFKDKLVDKLKEEANKELNAELKFEDVDLSFFSHFPELTLEINELSIVGVDNFEGVELISFQTFGMSLGLGKVIKGELPEILKLYIHEPSINLIVKPSGIANWDIVKSSGETDISTNEDTAVDEQSDFSIQLNYYEITNAHLKYHDQSSATLVVIDNLSHSGSGDFSKSTFALLTKTSIENILVEFEGEKYVNNWGLDTKINLDVNMEANSFRLTDNELKINEFLLKSEGEVIMGDSSIYMDLNVSAPNIDLRQLISLLPPTYSSDLDGVSIGGNSSFNAWVKGDYTDSTYPLFALDLEVNNGSFKYPDLPKTAEDIEIKTHVELPDVNDLDKLWINIEKFNVNLGGNLIAAGFTLNHPLTSMDFTSRLSAAIDFTTLKDVLPQDNEAVYSGIMRANMNAKGSLTKIEAEDYEELEANGKLHLEAFNYYSTQFSMPVKIQKALLVFEMDELELESFEANIGESNVMLDGKLKNFIPYALFDKQLYGELNLKSTNLNINEMMSIMIEDTANNEVTQSEKGTELVEPQIDTVSAMLPKNIDFKMRTGVSKLKYQQLELIDFQGDLVLKDGILTLNSCKANTLGGQLNMSGSFDESIVKAPMALLNFSFTDINIKESGEKIEMIANYSPITKYTSGKVSGKLSLETSLDEQWNPIYESVYSKGNIKSKKVKVEGFEVIDKLASLTKMEEVLDNEFEDININYEIIDGKAYIKPFDFKIDQLTGNSSGSLSLDQQIDFDVHMSVPTEMLGSGAGQLLGQLAGALSGLGLESEVPEKIEMDIKITGTVDKPIIKPNFSGVSGSTAKEVVKEKIKEEIDKAKEEALDKAAEEAEKIMKDAKKEAAKLLKEAQKNIDQLKKEGYAQADKLEAEASNYFEKIAAKAAATELKKQIDKQAANAMKEAKAKADKILADAQKQADRLKN